MVCPSSLQSGFQFFSSPGPESQLPCHRTHHKGALELEPQISMCACIGGISVDMSHIILRMIWLISTMVISYFPLTMYHSDSHAIYYKDSTHSAKEQASELNCRARLTFVSHDKPNRPWGAPSKLTYIVQQVERWRTRERQRYNSQQSCTSLTVTHSTHRYYSYSIYAQASCRAKLDTPLYG